MKKIIKIVLLLFGLIFIGLAILFYLLGSACQNQVYKEYLSPDKSLKAVIFQRDCGATTGFSTQISIIDANDTLENERGNIYIIDGHPRTIAPILSWKNSELLYIHRSLNGDEHKSESSYGLINSIKIRYEKM